VRVESDDNTHFAARIISREFTGKRAIARHQLVYKALGERMDGKSTRSRSKRSLPKNRARADMDKLQIQGSAPRGEVRISGRKTPRFPFSRPRCSLMIR